MNIHYCESSPQKVDYTIIQHTHIFQLAKEVKDYHFSGPFFLYSYGAIWDEISVQY